MSKGKAPARWLLYAPLAAGALIVGAYYLLWSEGAETMRRSIDRWADGQRARGVDVVYDRIKTRGFPFVLRGELANASIEGEDGVRWSAKTLHIDALPYDLDRLIFSTRNAQTLELGEFGVWTLEAENGRASLATGRAWALDVESGPGALTQNQGGATLSAEHFLLSVAPQPSTPHRLAASLVIDGATAVLTDDAISAPRIEAFVEWTDPRLAAPELNLRRIAFEAEGAIVFLEGKLQRDSLGFPAGVLQAEITNPAGLATLIEKLGLVSKDEADRARAALVLAALAGGGKIQGPVELKGGQATIAGVKIAGLPRLDYP